MTDPVLLPPVPAPRPAATQVERLLSERIFVLAKARGLRVPRLHPRHGGLALCGPDALRKVQDLRHHGYSGLLIADPGFYTDHVATPDQPFTIGDGDLFGVGLERDLRLQIESEASVAFTPTRFLRAGDRDALRAVVAAVEVLHGINIIVVIPAGVGWLLNDNIDLFTAALSAIPHPIALALGGQFNPPDRHGCATANLRRLLVEAPGVALWRTDLAAFDGIAHGAPFAAFGLSTTLRHIVPPGEKPQTSRNGGPVPATVLVPQLLRFTSGPALARRYANVPALTCNCQICRGAGLNRFDGFDGETHTEAEDHNAAVLNDLLSALFSRPGLGDRQAWWRNTCVDAVNAYEVENNRIRQPGAFKPDKDLQRWATMPVTHAPTPLPVEDR